MDFFKKYRDWRGDRKLPVSFFLFFFLTFFLMGEQLIAIPLYLFGPISEDGADKVAILDLAASDALHRPLFFLLFSFITWMMLRFFRWPIVWIGASTMWLVFKWLLPDPGKTQSIIWTFVGVGIFILTPYFIYRTVDRRWGAKGRRNAILIVAALNILLLVFFAYQIYGLNNSYYGQASHGSLIRNESNQQTYQNLVMIAPYADESEISRIGPYSATDDSPLGIKHPGIDFFPVSDMIPFRAVTNGKITNFRSEGGNTQFCIDHSPFLVCYSFETFSSDDAVSQRQRDNVFVKNGDEVKQGDVIGKLIYGGDGAHVDLGVLRLGENGERICPESYFTEEAKILIRRLIRKDHPDWLMCYMEDQPQTNALNPQYPSSQVKNQTTNQTSKQESRPNQSWEGTSPQTQDLIESCPKNISGIFTYPIANNDDVENIPPLGHINAKNKHVIPISHTYYAFKKDGDVIRRAQIFAPADSLLQDISKVDVLDKSGKVIDSDFSIYFSPCQEIRVSFIHVRELSNNLKKMYEATQPYCYVEEKNSLSLCKADINKMIKAGDPIGWGGGSLPALDVAVDDARVINPFISPERYTSHNLQGICPLDLYSGDLKISVYNKLMDPDGNKRITEPKCGSVAQDILGTAQGEWFIGSAREPGAESEGKVLSIIHYNLEPTLGLPGIIAASGTIVPYSGMLAFVPRHDGFINREPSEIVDAHIYCFQNEQGEYTKYVVGDGKIFTGRILVQLLNATSLKAEYQEKSCAGNLDFNSPTIYER